LFKEGKNCCQSVVLAFADTLWLNKRRLKALTSPFGHGIDTYGNEICGAATGMLMIIGITHPGMNKKTMRELSQKALDEFREKTGGLRCHEFTRDKDLPEGAEIPLAKRKEGVCENLIETAILIAKKYMP
jgi:C_GCAxxG_C_C family probable redox protein